MKPEIKIINIKGSSHLKLSEGMVYVGRRARGLPESPLANPFKIGPDGTREEVIAKYRAWLEGAIQRADIPAIAELERLYEIARDTGRLTLACWCHPQPCHADVIAAAIKKMFD